MGKRSPRIMKPTDATRDRAVPSAPAAGRNTTTFEVGGLAGTRTRDQRLKRPLLYRLSYQPGAAEGITLLDFSGGIEPARDAPAKSRSVGKLINRTCGRKGFLPGLPSAARPVHSILCMKSPLFLVASLAVLLVGCATADKAQVATHETPYDKPLTSPGAKFGALPPIVQRTVLAEVGQGEVIDAVRDTSSGRVVYKIYFRDRELFPPLYVAPDGSVLNPDLTVAVRARPATLVRLADLPAKVRKAIPERAPAAEVSYINKESWGDLVVYVVTFKDEAHNPRLLLSEEGTVMDETQVIH